MEVELVSSSTVKNEEEETKDAEEAEAEAEDIVEESQKEKTKPEPFNTNGEDFTCTACGKVYKRLGSMKTHVEKNHGIMNSIVFFCKKCNKKFDTKKKLTRHENSKTDCCQ